MRKRVLPSALLASMFLFASNALAAPPDLASADWSAKAPHNLAINPPPDQAVKVFVAKMEGAKPDGICSSHFADLRHLDTLSLVVSTIYGRFCSSSIFDKAAWGFEWYDFDSDSGVPEIKDLARDGDLELVVPTDFTSYDGAQHCVASWPVIYAWTGSDYTDVSSRYKVYYKQQLAVLQKDIATTEAQNARAEQASAAQGAESSTSAENGVPAGLQFGNSVPTDGKPQTTVHYGPNGEISIRSIQSLAPLSPPRPPAAPPPDRMGLDCTKAEAAKIERFLGISRDAGMSDAIKWAHSDNPNDRSFAAEVLADIGTPDAIEYLGTLSNDPVRIVAMFGKSGLLQASRRPAVHTVDREQVTGAAGKPIQ